MKACVYSVLTGGYEDFNDQPLVSKNEGVQFICFTDDPALRHPGWEFRPIESLFRTDPVRSQREVKIRPHRYLPDYDLSLYVDNSVLLTRSPLQILERFAGHDFVLPWHSFRATLLEEFDEVLRTRLDEESRILEQLEEYRTVHPEVLLTRPWWSAIMLRRHHDEAMIRFGEVWALHVHRYARRDQLSSGVAMQLANVEPTPMRIDTYVSWFHAWPRTRNRRMDIRAGTVDPVRSRMEALAISVAEERARMRLRASVTTQMLMTNQALARRGMRRGFEVSKKVIDTAVQRLPQAFVVCPNGRTIFINPRDSRGKTLVARRGDVDPEAMKLWKYLLGLEPWTDVIDVGTGYGEHFANVFLPEGARVLACETDASVLPFLKTTLEGFDTPVELVSGEITSETLGALLERPDDAPGGRRALVRLRADGREFDLLAGLGETRQAFAGLQIMLQVTKLDDPRLAEVLQRFRVHLFDLNTCRLLPLPDACVATYRQMLERGDFHVRDAVLIPC